MKEVINHSTVDDFSINKFLVLDFADDDIYLFLGNNETSISVPVYTNLRPFQTINNYKAEQSDVLFLSCLHFLSHRRHIFIFDKLVTSYRISIQSQINTSIIENVPQSLLSTYDRYT